MTIRNARTSDGALCWQLVKETGQLELNTAYCYLMMSKLFSDTCLVAEEPDGSLSGFVMAFVPPRQRDTLFVWQIGVHPRSQGRGLATGLLDALTRIHPEAKYLEASVTPGNDASMNLFRRWGQRRGLDCRESDFLASEDFPQPHECERLLKIGPLAQRPLTTIGGRN